MSKESPNSLVVMVPLRSKGGREVGIKRDGEATRFGIFYFFRCTWTPPKGPVVVITYHKNM